MKPRRTPEANVVFELPGGNEDNSLWVHQTVDEDGREVIVSTWELTHDEIGRILDGERICLQVLGRIHPPVWVGMEGDLYEERKRGG